MTAQISPAQIETIKDKINFDRRFVAAIFSAEMLANAAILDELIASTRAEVNPHLVKWIQQGKTPHEALSGNKGPVLNPRQDIFSLVEELWIECLTILAADVKVDRRKVRKAVNQGKRTAIGALQRDQFLLKQVKRDRKRD